MTVSPELFMAILSMDAYNRGYNAGMEDGVGIVDDVDIDGLGEIGNATIITRVDAGIDDADYQTWQSTGFYAVAYDWNGQTVISYRGTDDPLSVDPSNDILTGWLPALASAAHRRGIWCHSS